MKPRLSIVIPVYNRRNVVGRTLSSIKSQKLFPLELVIVDNNSTDGTYEYLDCIRKEASTDRLLIKLLRETKPGAAAARNRGLEEVTTPWVMFFDSDDVMTPDHCSRALEAARSNPGAEIIGWNTEICLADGTTRIGRFPSDNFLWNNVFHGGLATQRWMARTGLIRKIGGWNESVMMWDDIELGTRMLTATDRIVCIGGNPTVRVFHTPGSITYSNDGFADKMIHAANEIGRSLPSDYRRWIPFKLVLGAAFYGFANPDSAIVTAEAQAMVSPVDATLLKILLSYLKYMKRGGVALIAPFLNADKR